MKKLLVCIICLVSISIFSQDLNKLQNDLAKLNIKLPTSFLKYLKEGTDYKATFENGTNIKSNNFKFSGVFSSSNKNYDTQLLVKVLDWKDMISFYKIDENKFEEETILDFLIRESDYDYEHDEGTIVFKSNGLNVKGNYRYVSHKLIDELVGSVLFISVCSKVKNKFYFVTIDIISLSSKIKINKDKLIEDFERDFYLK